ncbi:hypothetical protein M446_0724 [Methylobacterium sp. 4-46]|uniref:hypothetical protein n=1 Tax=unclassified Methylobacterium TaxID=2615210 RepID=UPI000152C23F|nr:MULTISPECIES: hypothetical protein [Methylobacterium]ACA15283.1 hypothetical protein M446_0724 [Methylobacterium sp. 4-46]WFT81011.1 hypothetical protein QA634_03660 [Methylobacterium nodulans]
MTHPLLRTETTDDDASPRPRAEAALDLDSLDGVVGGLATYYEMNGNWYIVGHDKSGKATGVVRVT